MDLIAIISGIFLIFACCMVGPIVFVDLFYMRPLRKKLEDMQEDLELAHRGLEVLNGAQWRLAQRVERGVSVAFTH